MPTSAAARRALALTVAALCAVPAAPLAARAADPRDDRAPPGFAALDDVAPTVLQDMRYAGPHNFTGAPVPGYDEPVCLLTRPAAEALARAQRALRRSGYSLKVYDCYRPRRAVDHFLRWAADPHDTRMRREFYPAVDKGRLFADRYLAAPSGHSRGSEVDVTLVPLGAPASARYRPGQRLVPCTAPDGERFADNSADMGTGYDCFDPLSRTLDPRAGDAAAANRALLARTLEREGFVNFPDEWWHFSFRPEPFPHTAFDFPVRRSSVHGGR
ncbi:D-alanyl-D-alanine dipeptidase [Streptomyces sp. RB5]|uniref:D-alanyl-D-alanine dipeptidase n=1 Tax=Streptomyces smaragdinus TaxID=2585196 RepID=A0A7K0CPE5_9ACTN|nr:M15 family metallopeptidase [Streptomyces smaragdinus]MQY14892.1 D-alanyl-D-alanine dipeptidase [Streptomyces smaragdinus]